MKISKYRVNALLGLAAIGGFSMVPLSSYGQRPDLAVPSRRPAPPAAEKSDVAGIRGMFRQMVELKRAGKTEEANQMARRIRAVSKDNPRVIAALESMKNAPTPDAAPKPVERPKAKKVAKAPKVAKAKKNGDHPRGKRDTDRAKPPVGPKAADCPKAKTPECPLAKKAPKGAKAGNMDPKAKLNHMRQAAKHLDAAGIAGLAKVIRVHVAAMEKGLANPHGPMNRPMAKRMPMGKPGPGGVRPDGRGRGFRSAGRPFTPPQRPGMQGAPHMAPPKAPTPKVPSTKAPMNPNAALIGEIRKLRQEMGDLRKQVNRIQGDTKRKAPRDKAAPAPATR